LLAGVICLLAISSFAAVQAAAETQEETNESASPLSLGGLAATAAAAKENILTHGGLAALGIAAIESGKEVPPW